MTRVGVSCREPSSFSSRFHQQQPINPSTSDEINEVAIPASLCALSHQPAVMWGDRTTLTAPDFQQTRDYTMSNRSGSSPISPRALAAFSTHTLTLNSQHTACFSPSQKPARKE
ncbi:uncharacterized protein TrAtP1_010482 [Trichoderma atroviride]|uniref:uncharacterized protein n=1 Tax=Hypocrea atroviridis TaxID=63577 RepID=UPI0033231918|nr:hypothetical protein TrAtP1_010482 [Trichoderma atroviride]